MPTKIYLFKIPQFETKSAFDKNFKAKASSRNPNIILNLVIQPPDFGIFFTTLGKNDKNENGNANANPNPKIATVKSVAPESTVRDPTSKEPRIGPVHEKETIANVNAMKKIPVKLVISDEESELFSQLTGRVIS